MTSTPRKAYWTVEPKTTDSRGKVRMYQLRWNGGAKLTHLKDGETYGSFRTKKLAEARALQLNTSRAEIEKP